MPKKEPPFDPPSVAKKLLPWYARHRRSLPWRAEPGEKADPYAVFLSELMLQQTGVTTVGPYFLKFMKRWPTVKALARAPLEEVLQQWSGLGYYRRARSLHEAARYVTEELGGIFPSTEEALQKLPGCGPYTSAAVAAIAFDKPANVVDGNIERVVARLFALEKPMPSSKKELRSLASTLVPKHHAGDYAQAMMDLGSSVCTPRSPKCETCPLASLCQAKAQDIAESLPRRSPKKAKPVRRAIAFCALDEKSRLYICRRPMKGLLAGMMEVPTTPWLESSFPKWPEAKAEAPFEGPWRLLEGTVHHSFTHFDFEIGVAVAKKTPSASRRGEGKWVTFEALDEEALPSVMRKIALYAKASFRKEKA